MKENNKNKISDEVLAAYFDGNATLQETNEILDSLTNDSRLRELMDISLSVDAEMGLISKEDIIPMTALAASCEEGNYCSLECEKYVLSKIGVSFNEQKLLEDALKNGWQKDDGTALHNVGRHLEKFGLIVTRHYGSKISDIADSLINNKHVIVAVDGGELLGNRETEREEDIILGPNPDHTIVVLSCDIENNTIKVFDPNSSNIEDEYSIEQFEDAWRDSNNYLVTIGNELYYIPKPIDISDIELSEDLNDLREAIAENAHEIWAESRMAEGWTYGPERNDELKQTPDMLPYSLLPESEKEYDRQMAMKTIKLLKKLGYELVKRDYMRCNQCNHKVLKTQSYCHNCGTKL